MSHMTCWSSSVAIRLPSGGQDGAHLATSVCGRRTTHGKRSRACRRPDPAAER
jgi:hypothetical protein